MYLNLNGKLTRKLGTFEFLNIMRIILLLLKFDRFIFNDDLVRWSCYVTGYAQMINIKESRTVLEQNRAKIKRLRDYIKDDISYSTLLSRYCGVHIAHSIRVVNPHAINEVDMLRRSWL